MEDLRKFLCPEFVFGHGALQLIGQHADHLSASRVLIVTDEGIQESGWAVKVMNLLENRSLSYEVFDHISPNPRDQQIMEGAEFYNKKYCDVIVAVGGGSVIDAAKGIGIVASNGGHILDYEGVDRIPAPIPPLICIPTTCGSSADVSQFAIITDTDSMRKIAIISKSIVPDVSLIDPSTLQTMSQDLMEAVSLDTLTHAIEAYVSQANSFMTDRHALGAISLIGKYFYKAISERDNPEYQSRMMQASLEAGLAFSNASLGLVHAMAHVLGGLKDFPHGICNGLLLKNVSLYNYEACPERFDTISRTLSGIQDERISPGRSGLGNALDNLILSTATADKIHEFELSKDDCRTLAGLSMKDACIVTNPKEPQFEEIVSLYEKTFRVS